MTAALMLPLEELLGVALAEAEGEVGDSAPALLVRAYAYAAQQQTDGYLPLSVLSRLTHHRHPKKVIASLEAAGALVAHGRGYRLARYLEVNPSRERLEAARAAERNRKRKAEPTPEPPSGSTPESGPESDPESTPPSTPESGPESGRVSVPPSLHSPLSLNQNSEGENPGVSRARVGEGPEARPESTPEARPETPASSGPVPVRKRAALPPRRDLVAAYAAGVSAATGAPCTPPSEAWNVVALEAIARAHLDGLSGAPLLAGLTGLATAYVSACRDSAVDRGKGYSAERCRTWLDAGRPAAPPASTSRPSRTAPPQPADPGSSKGSRWQPAVDLDTFAAEEARAAAGGGR